MAPTTNFVIRNNTTFFLEADPNNNYLAVDGNWAAIPPPPAPQPPVTVPPPPPAADIPVRFLNSSANPLKGSAGMMSWKVENANLFIQMAAVNPRIGGQQKGYVEITTTSVPNDLNNYNALVQKDQSKYRFYSPVLKGFLEVQAYIIPGNDGALTVTFTVRHIPLNA